MYYLPVSTNILDLRFCEGGPLTNSVIQLSSAHVLQNQHYVLVLFKHFVDVNDVGVVQTDQHLDLVLGGKETGLAELGCEYLAGVFADCPFDCAVGSI